MRLPIKFIALATVAVIVLVLLLYSLNFFSATSEITAKNKFAEGCLLYCEEISRSSDPVSEAINKSEYLEGSEFIKSCKFLYPDVKYNWQCWNRNCCKFRVYSPL